jgi:hypothetical protein
MFLFDFLAANFGWLVAIGTACTLHGCFPALKIKWCIMAGIAFSCVVFGALFLLLRDQK